MKSNFWKSTTLGSILPFKYGKNLPAAKRSSTGEFEVVTSAGVVDSHNEAVTTGECVVVGRKGTIGALTYCKKPVWPTDTTFYVEGSEQCVLRFGYYLLHTLPLSQMNNDSAVPGLNRNDAESLIVEVPPLAVQRDIASVLGALDDKIAANGKVVAVSNDLCAGLVAKNIDDTAALADVANIAMGTSPKGDYLNEGGRGVPFFQGVRDFGVLYPQDRVFTEHSVRSADLGDILFAVRAPIGKVNVSNSACSIGRGIAAIRGKSGHLTLFHLLRSRPEIWDSYQDNGTVFAAINSSDLRLARIPWIRDVDRVESMIRPIHERAITAQRENQALAKTRDELLPLLMSGKITVREAEETAAEVGVETREEEGNV